MSRRKTTEQFIKDSKKIHGDKYDYNKVSYINAITKVCIICPKHGEFWQKPNNHLNGQGCPVCNGGVADNKDTFIQKANKVHNYKYDYSKVIYKNAFTKVCIICPEHGEFWQLPLHHLNGHGCPTCVNHVKKTIDNFIRDAKQVHGDKYNYSKVEYINNHTKVCIICPEHGEFWQTPKSHLKGSGCPKHPSSHGENEIRNYLRDHNIQFEQQKKFEDCRNRFLLPFDFYLPDYNLCIEYQGEQHYKSVDFFGGNIKFKERQLNDSLKKEWCSKPDNPDLLEIRYNENIREILNKTII